VCILQLTQDNPNQKDKKEIIKFALKSIFKARDLRSIAAENFLKNF